MATRCSGFRSQRSDSGETQYWRLADAQTSLNIVLRVNGKRQPLLVTSRDLYRLSSEMVVQRINPSR